MGLKPYDLHTLTIKDFALMHLAYLEAEEKKSERARRIVEAVVNCAGFGSGKYISKEQLWPLNIDERREKQPIVNKGMAIRLLNSF